MLTVKIERSRYTMIEECQYGVSVVTPKHKDFKKLSDEKKVEGNTIAGFITYDSPNCEPRCRTMVVGDKVYIMNASGKTIDTLYFNKKAATTTKADVNE